MAKFKVGDRVRIVRCRSYSGIWTNYIGSVRTIKDFARSGTKENGYSLNECLGCWFDDELELVKED